MHTSIANLTFGAEFEVIIPNTLTRQAAAAQVAAHAGFPVFSDNGYRAPSGQWKVVADGSLFDPSGHGLEFVSPVLRGDEGLEQIRKICAALTSIGARVNSTCGFHVHVGARGQPIDFFKTLVKLYARFEDALDQIMPTSRRADNNQYCGSVKAFHPERLEGATNLNGILAALPPGRGGRYYKLNVAAFVKHSTVEFRQHAGTLDADKATNWIKTCLRLVAAAKAGKTGAGPRIARDFSRLDAKARAVAEAILRPQGATADEIRAAHGFRALSVNRQARVAGLEVTTRRERGKDRFFAVAPTDTTQAIPATLDGLAQVIEADETERAFLAARAQALANG